MHLAVVQICIVYQEFLQHIFIECSGLWIAERSLHQHRVSTLVNDSLKFSVGNGQSQVFSFCSNQFVVDV